MRRAHRDGRRAGPAAVPTGDRGPAAHVGLLRSEQGGVRGVRPTPRRSSKGCRSTRRSSTWAGCGGYRARPPRSRCSCGSDVLERVGPADHGRGGPHQVPRQGGERRGEARRPARRAARRRARVPAPAAGRAALGGRAGDRRQAPRARDHDGRRGRAALRGVARLDARPGVRAGTCTRSRTTAIPRPVQRRPPPALDRLAARARAARPGRPTTSTPCSSGSSTASPVACARAGGSGAPSCCGCASTTSPARRGRTRCRGRPRRRETILAAARALLADGAAD